jgi:hypothetical protein
MAHTTIHDHNVSYDDSHERLRHAVYYLESVLSRDEAETFFQVARTGTHAHFEDEHHTNLGLKKEGEEYILYLREE